MREINYQNAIQFERETKPKNSTETALFYTCSESKKEIEKIIGKAGSAESLENCKNLWYQPFNYLSGVTGDRPTAKWKNPKSIKYKTFDDSKPPAIDYWLELERVSKNRVVWGGNYFTEYLPPSKGWIVWNKQSDIKEHLSMAELAWTSFDIKCNMFDYLWAGFKKKHQVERIHPTQKPIDLYRFILTYYAKQGQKILDTHLGSQSSRIAAWGMGFDFWGCEIDEQYFNEGCKRFENETMQTALWVG